MIYFVVALFGLVVGSFLNVCIVRIPAGTSIVRPGSHCPNCQHPLRWYHNIPLLSFLLLKGKCAFCQANISWRYPMIELSASAIAVVTFHHFGQSAQFVFYLGFIWTLLVIALIDWSTGLIHNKILISLFVFGLMVNLVAPVRGWEDALTGTALGGGSVYIFAVLGRRLFHRESMGMGDVKLAAVAGLFLGVKLILIALYAGFVFAFIYILILRAFRRKQVPEQIHMGPFLAIGLVVFLFWGDRLIHLYLNLFV
jgi:leader peptidase (prepilin peptidase)/N-methyltransferase